MIGLIIGFLVPAALFAICGLVAWVRRCIRPAKHRDEMACILRADQLTHHFTVCTAEGQQEYVGHYGQYSQGRFNRIPLIGPTPVVMNMDLPPSYSEATNLASLTIANDESLTSISCTGYGISTLPADSLTR